MCSSEVVLYDYGLEMKTMSTAAAVYILISPYKYSQVLIRTYPCFCSLKVDFRVGYRQKLSFCEARPLGAAF